MERPFYPPRSSSRFTPGVYFNVEFGLSLTTSHERPPVRAGVQYASRHMQDRIYRQQHPAQNQHSSHHQSYQHPERNLPSSPTTYDQTREYQQERQRRLGVRTLGQHERSSSAPPTIDRDDLVSPLTPEETFRAVLHTNSFPRETLDRPLPYSPARFRLGEDDLPWSVPPWYRAIEPELTSPIIPRKPLAQQHRALQRGASVTSIASMAGGLPSIGFEHSEREREPRATSNRGREPSRRPEDPQRVRDLGELQQAMMTVDSLHQDPWSRDEENAVGAGENSLGWAVRMEPDLDFAFAGGFHGGGEGGGLGYSAFGEREGLMRSPPPYVDEQWEEIGRRIDIGGYRPRTSGY